MTKTAKTAAKTPSLAKASAAMGKAMNSPKASATKAAAGKKAIEGKSNRKNATTPAFPDAITEVRNGGGEIAFVMAGKEKLAVPAHKLRGEMLAMATVGASLGVLRAALGQTAVKPKLATGVDSRNSPQSAKAVSDSNRGAAPDAGAAPKAKAAPDAGAAPKAKAGKALTYKTGPKSNDARVGSWRYYMLAVIQGAGDRDAAEAMHASGKHENFAKEFAGKKLDVRWALAEGYITAK